MLSFGCCNVLVDFVFNGNICEEDMDVEFWLL
jgi:hypothetical protein